MCALFAATACAKETPSTETKAVEAPPAVAAPKKQDAAPLPAPDNKRLDSPKRKTAYPSDAEWDALKKEVTVKGSSALACVTKLLDGYLRVHCTKNDLGAPTSLLMTSPLPKNALAATGDEALTLVHPFVAGTKIEATFSWEKESHPFRAEWLKGEARPEIIGVFEGAASPLDRLAPRTTELLTLVSKFHADPKPCLGEVPTWSSLDSYAKVVAVGKKDFEVESHCSPSLGPDDKETGGFNCCVSFNEGATRDDDEGYGSATQVCFDIDQKRSPNEASIECHFAG